MRSSSTFSILFWTYKARKDKNNQTQIYARITLDGAKANISLKEKVHHNSVPAPRRGMAPDHRGKDHCRRNTRPLGAHGTQNRYQRRINEKEAKE